MNKGQKILKSAKKIRFLGNQLLSKKDQKHLPYLAKYFLKAKGCEIWDLENKNIMILQEWVLRHAY